MSSYFKFRLALAAIGLVVGACVMVMRRDHADGDARKVAHRLVAHVEGYDSASEYYDQLADDAHNQCFEECYHSSGYGRHDTSWFDGTQYTHELFRLMIEEATADKAVAVAASLNKYRLANVDVGEDPPANPKTR